MEKAQAGIHHPHQRLGSIEGAVAAPGDLHLGNFKVPVGKITPEELVDLPSSFAILIIFKETLSLTGSGH